jgi:hypothetical protein
MHWLPRQTRPSLHVLPTGMWLAAQSAASTQQRFGLGFVHATTTTRLTRTPRMQVFSPAVSGGCEPF